MEESNKKRSRKTKLVPRQYLDSDDENIAVMQQEIEAELANLKAQSLLKKLSSSSSQPKTDEQFSVKVEIEEYDEELTDEEIFSLTCNDPDSEKDEKVMSLDPKIANPENTIIKTECADIETVKNGQELLKDCKSDRDDKVVQDMNIRIESVRSLQNVDKIEVSCYKMTKIMIKKEFEIFSKTTVSYTDKLLEIHIRNYFGQDISEVKLNQTEIKIQEVITKWGTWMTCDPLIRDTPLMYICSICEKAWWYLHDLKEHIKYHGKFGITFYTLGHNSYIVVTNKRKMRDCGVPIKRYCWRCGKGVSHHSHKSFKCDGCEESFHTCLLLTMHEGDCKGNRKFYQRASNNTYLEFKCPVCPWKHWKEEELLRHQVGLHSVRSDLPMPFKPKRCGSCNKFLSRYNAHDCIAKVLKESCKFCFRKFQNKSSLLLHYWVSPNNYFKCRVCGKLLKKECAEFEHLLEHTDNYKMLYMCLVCKDTLCFFDLHSVKNHETSCHVNKVKTDGDYCPVVVPKSLLQRLEPMKVFVTTPEDIYIDRNDTTHEDQEDQDVDSAFQGLLGYLVSDKNAVKKTPQNKETVNKNNIDVENNIQITIINKDIVQKIMNSVKSNDIPDIIKKIKNENTEDINNSNMNTLQAYNYEGDLHVNNNNDGPDKKLSTYSRTRSKKNLQSTDVGDGIKEYVTTDVVKIKEEPMNIDENNGINEVNDIDLIDNNKNNNININNDMNDVILNSVLQEIDDINIPIKLEIKEECDDMYKDDIILLNENVLKPTKPRKKLPKSKRVYNFSKTKVMDKYMMMIHNDESRYSCTKCNTVYISFKKYLMHFVKHDYEPLTCPKCMKRTSNEQQFWSHMNYHIKSSYVRVHTIANDSSDQSSFQCKKCQLVLGYDDFFKHWEDHLDIQSVDVMTQFSVNMDGKPKLKEMIMLLRDPEKISLSQWKTRACNECDKRFERKNDYKRHFIEHLLRDALTEKYKYGCLKCQICGHESNSSDRYKRHLRDHASLPVYKCDLCDKAFSDSSNFSKHKKVHNLSVLICHICQKKFQKKEYLIKHLEMHEVTKPIVCETCNKIFYSQSVYSKHLKKNRPRFRCHVCVTFYSTLREKWDHMWQVHKERKHVADCPFCEQSYRKYSDVKKHIKDEHDNAYHKYYNKSGKILFKEKSDDEMCVE